MMTALADAEKSDFDTWDKTGRSNREPIFDLRRF
jgi:hypothetical protein